MNPLTRYFSLLALIFTLLLSGCSKPETPQQVSQAFWQSVINNDVAGVVRYSTLGSESGYESFSRDWSGMIPSWGKIIIEEREARVHTHVSTPDAASSEMLNFVTYLVKQDEQWKVDYENTEKAVLASAAIADFVNRITTLGNEISQQFEDAGKALNNELEERHDQFQALAEDLGSQASQAMEDYSLLMRKHLDALSQSIADALREKQDEIPPADRQLMEDTAKELNESSEKLTQPDLDSIADTGEVIVITRKNLASLDAETFNQYQLQWQEWMDRVSEDLQNLFEQLAKETK